MKEVILTTPKKNKFGDIIIPWYVRPLLLLCRPKLGNDFSSGMKKICRYKTLGKKKYAIDYDFDIKKKKAKVEIKMIF